MVPKINLSKCFNTWIIARSALTICCILYYKHALKIINISMLRSFLRFPLFKFSFELETAYALKYKIKDVTKIRGLKTQNPYVIIEDKKISIPTNKILAHVMSQSPFHNPNERPNIRFLDTELNIYNPACPTLTLLENNFYIKLNSDLYFVANNESMIKTSFNAQYIVTDAPACLQPIVEASIQSLNQVPENISPSNLNTMLIKNVLDHSLKFKLQKIQIKQLLKIVNSRLQQFESQIAAINQLVHRKAIKKTKLFSSFMFLQYAIIHYFIYFHLSWDIMEPITVIIGNLDILLGYYFFVFKGREYSLEEVQKNLQEKHRYSYLKKYKFNVQKYEELLQLKEIFQMKLDLHSKSPFVIMNRLQKPIRLLDSR